MMHDEEMPITHTSTIEVAASLTSKLNAGTKCVGSVSLVLSVPSLCEFALALLRWSEECSEPLHAWLVIDGCMSLMFIVVNLVSMLKTRKAVEEDEQLRVYLARQARDGRQAAKEEEMEKRIMELNADSRHLQTVCGCLPFVLVIAGWLLWHRTTSDTCDAWLRQGSLAVMLFKVLVPAAAGTALVLLLCRARHLAATEPGPRKEATGSKEPIHAEHAEDLRL